MFCVKKILYHNKVFFIDFFLILVKLQTICIYLFKKSNMKKYLLILIAGIFLASCGQENTNDLTQQNTQETIKIVSTITPFASIANYIGWEHVEVNSIIQPGFSPHSFEMKPSDIKNLHDSDLILSTWLELDNFIIEKISQKNILELKDSIKLLEWHDHHNHSEDKHHEDEHHEDEHHEDEHHEDEHHEDEHHEDEHHEDEHHEDEHHEDEHHEDEHHEDEHHEDEHHEDEHHEDEHHEDEHHEDEEIFFDPHFWLSLENGKVIATSISTELSRIDPKNKQYYENNLKEFITQADEIKNNYSMAESTQDFIIFHEAFNYLFNEFNILDKNVLVLEETAGREPSVWEMKIIIDEINQRDVKTIFKEPQFESKLIETLTSDYQLELYILDPLWNSIEKNGYFDTIQSNLDNLKNIYE